MEIRQVQLNEIEGVLKLIDQYERPKAPWPKDEEIEKIYSQLKQSGGCVFGAFNQGEIVGSCTVNICPNFSWSGRPYAIIENVIITKSQQKKGLGKAILNFAKRYAEKRNCYKVALLTGSTKPEVSKFYESAGFEASKTGYQARFDA